MATSVKHNLNENVAEVKKTEDLREIHGVSSSQLRNHVMADDSINEITKQVHCQDDNNVSNVDGSSKTEKNRMKDNSFTRKFNTEMVDGAKKVTEHSEERHEDSNITSLVLIDQSKNNNYHAKSESIVGETVVGKRKRGASSDVKKEKTSSNDSSENTKQKKQKNTNDSYCWRCHKDIVEANCSACPRSWHRKCMGGTPPTSTTDNWICGECASILQAENAATRSPTMAHLTVDQLCMVLKYVIERMRKFPGAEPFWTAVDLKEVPNYLDYVVKPMDLCLLESNVNSKLYGSTDAFMADAKWIQHNCIVFNTCGGEYADTSKLTNAAKQMIKIARQEVSEIEACPDCYARGRNLPRPHPSWFIESCRQPHPLVWAKLKGFPFWPAKALPRINGQGHVDVRFFGEHDRAWVSPKDIYLYSRDPPTPLPRKKKQDMSECIKEIAQHCQKLEMTFGPFQFAPPRIQYNPHDPMQIKLIFPEYDPDHSQDDPKALYRDIRTSSPARKQSLLIKNPSSPANDALINGSSSIKDCESTMECSDNPIELQNNSKDHSRENNESSKQKSRIRKLRTAVGVQDDLIKSSDSSGIIGKPPMKKIITVTPKNQAAGKTLSKKFTESKKFNLICDKSIGAMLQKLPPKNRQNFIRKVNATSTSLLAPNANGKIIKPSIIRIYKPKARIVDKLNAEEHEINKEISIMKCTNSEETQKTQGIIIDESASQANASSSRCLDESIVDSPNEKTITSRSDSESKESINPQLNPTVKRQSKARKSFPNKPPPAPIRDSVKLASNSPTTEDCIETNSNNNEMNYHLPPPEAGPLCAQLNRGANELAVRIGRLIEEAVQEAAQSKFHVLGNSVDAHQATVYSLRLQMERMRWQHQQQLAELKYNADQTLREMRASLEVERLRAIEEIRKEAEEERIKCVEETKSKQWCSSCGREALYYCCWNTAYCNHACQQMHWQTHMPKCSQKPTTVYTTTPGTQETSGAHQSQQQENHQQSQAMPILIICAQHGSSNVRGA